MMPALRIYWAERSSRERVLIGVMLALAGTMFLWFGVAQPLAAARIRADTRLATASDEAGLTAARRAARVEGAAYRGGAPADLVRTSGTAAGFTFTRVDGDGADGVAIAISSARAPALFTWLAGLERQGVRVATLELRANPDGTLAAQATLRGGR